jgi:hypothetical protein
VFSLVLPLERDERDEKRVEIEFIVQGSILSLEGATATLVCSVNGQTTVSEFPGASEQSVVQKLSSRQKLHPSFGFVFFCCSDETQEIRPPRRT